MTTSKIVSDVLKRFAMTKILIFLAVLTTQTIAFAQTTPVIPPGGFVAPNVVCEMVSTSTIDDPGVYGLKDKDGNPLQVGVPVSYPDLTLFKAYCHITNAVDPFVVDTANAVNTLIQNKYPSCATSGSVVCTLFQRVDPTSVLTGQRSTTPFAEFLIQNRTDTTQTIAMGDIKGQSSAPPAAPANSVFSPANAPWENLATPIYPPVQDPKCRVIVSGAIDPIPDNVAIPEVRVAKGNLLFTATVTGIVGMGGEVTNIKWTGGPDAMGFWQNPPLNKTNLVKADVTIKTGKVLQCSIKVITPVADIYSIGLSRYGDCGLFGGLRSYYFLNPSGKNFQTQGYSPPIMYPGNPVKYGQDGPDIPFRGVVNAAASKDGVINVGTNGDIVQPPVAYRKFSKPIIVARIFNKVKQEMSNKPVAWGELDPSNYAVTKMTLIENVSEDETVVFQAFLAAAQIKNGQDIRGSSDPDAIAYHDMRVGTSSDKPYDYLVPFVNASCGAMTITVPARGDKEVGPELAGVKLCSFSKTYQLKDLKSNNVSLDLMHIVPEHGTHTFPPNMLKTMAKTTTCNVGDPVKKDCWNVSASTLGVSASTNPFVSHESCRVVTNVESSSKVCDSYGGCKRVSVPTQQVSYKAGCKVIEENECGPGMAIRFSGYNQMMLASLGCAAKYNRPGEKVAATLIGQGIIPYTSFGGSAPKHYSQYPKAYGEAKGYACVPCRFASDSSTFEADTKTLPVDQDATQPRKPIYSFTKSSAAASCVKDVTFEVRYFGSKACDGVKAPPGHFCSSGNVAVQNCSTTDSAMTASKPFAGGGNIAGAFRISVCPGSGIDYDSVSVSWSPVIIDVAGNGIAISRNFDLARQFDIRGDGRARVLDWPLNNDEVAFLVRPGKNGQVTSIKELFGDYKAKNGFESMRKLDSNKDGVLNRKDKAFKELALWFDHNRNAKLDSGEIEALNTHGVYELPLSYVKPLRKGAEGKTLSTVYFNHKHQRYMNIEDHYFYEYITSGQKMSQK